MWLMYVLVPSPKPDYLGRNIPKGDSNFVVFGVVVDVVHKLFLISFLLFLQDQFQQELSQQS